MKSKQELLKDFGRKYTMWESDVKRYLLRDTTVEDIETFLSHAISQTEERVWGEIKDELSKLKPIQEEDKKCKLHNMALLRLLNKKGIK